MPRFKDSDDMGIDTLGQIDSDDAELNELHHFGVSVKGTDAEHMVDPKTGLTYGEIEDLVNQDAQQDAEYDDNLSDLVDGWQGGMMDGEFDAVAAGAMATTGYGTGGSYQSPWGKAVSKYSGKATSGYQMCYETHKPMKIGKYLIYGGSCSDPVVKDVDLFVGLDWGMAGRRELLPWVKAQGILYEIKDMTAPKELDDFNMLIEYIQKALENGKKVHVGCIGGHGRTGTVFAALVRRMLGREDAIDYVRKNYCKSAVESQSQIDFLHKNFGIKKAEPTKSSYSVGYTSSTTQSADTFEATPVESELVIWGDT